MPHVNHYGQPVGAPLPDWQPVAAPPRRALTGRFCTLTPLQQAHANALHAAYALAPDDRDWTWLGSSRPPSPAAMRDWIENKLNDPALISFTVVDNRSQQAVGVVCYANIECENGAIEIGHVTWSRHMQRNVIGSEAIILLLRQAFALGYRRVAWRCDSLNHASRRAAERLGFTFEGRFRQAMTRKQRNRDTDWLSMIDAEWPDRARAFDAWLAPSNIDEAGHARHSLRHFYPAGEPPA
ncbi:GNAT family N-acetyltransferase [Pantoea eucrina]|uniref:GNAT family N-acetyltransferase n=1 Tax=Pantoea eucrina TaxID=472693 RepID=A0ABU5LJP8_9GAMM|nr:GNAT family protein [Pantoea eucrina]MDZ7280154.1 GNAT family N-acetyltransferase [Pantoea eucrina]